MKKFFIFVIMIFSCGCLLAQAPANNSGVMLQAFYYDSYNATAVTTANGNNYGLTKWTDLDKQAQEIAETFDMIWLPPSAKSEDGSGYHPKQWSNQNSNWGVKTQLTNLIKKLKSYNSSIKVIADIVINHKTGNGVLDLDNEDFGKFGKFSLYESGKKSRYVCSDDEATRQGYQCTGARDAGYVTVEGVSGGYPLARDLDHSNSYLRDAIKAYLKWMKDEIGYNGWRYDYVQGYLGKYINEYNKAVGGSFSVGDYNSNDITELINWINATSKSSNVFDYNLKVSGFNNGLAKNDYSMLDEFGTGRGLISDNTYKQYAVSFVDNHETFKDEERKYNGDIVLANAYIIAMPGTPCVFYPHWVTYKEDIKKMIEVRKACGITNTSSASCTTTDSYFKGQVTGSDGNLVVFIGSQGTCPEGMHLACSGTNWAYYTTAPVGIKEKFIDNKVSKTMKYLDMGKAYIYDKDDKYDVNGVLTK